MEITDILKKPLITEKISTLSEKVKGGKERYAFVVDGRANKIQIADAIEKMYGVQVESVNTLRYKGKEKTRFTKSSIQHGRKSGYKKAIITLKEGEYIDFYENI
jgi:large subunit ribosomal protein L23